MNFSTLILIFVIEMTGGKRYNNEDNNKDDFFFILLRDIFSLIVIQLKDR